MEIIVSHINADFDCLASMIAAQKLYPNAKLVFSGSCGENVNDFLNKHSLPYLFEKPKHIKLEKVEKLILVDTSLSSRIGKFEELVNKVPIDIYDHHPYHPEDLKGKINYRKEVGATITILLELLKKKKIKITPQEATVFILGIYEDTGCLTFKITTKKDVNAVSYLIDCGGDITQVPKFIDREMTGEQITLLNNLIQSEKIYYIKDSKVIITSIKVENYSGDFSLLTHKLRDIEKPDCIFTLIQIQDRVNIIARSNTDKINVDKILRHFDGGGHIYAASASIKNGNLEEINKKLISLLHQKVEAKLVAKDIMTQKVISIDEKILCKDAKKLMIKYKIGGLPILSDRRIIGIITKHDLDNAYHHKLQNNPVISFMSTNVITVNPTTEIEEINKLLIEHHIGRVLVVIKEQMQGIITKSDLLKAMRKKTLEVSTHKNVSHLLKGRIFKEIYLLLQKIGKLSDELNYNAYVVGGFVRDLFLNIKNLDIDIVIEGDGIKFAKIFTQKFGGSIKTHPKFHTAIIGISKGFKIDIATARLESYEYPGALPEVEVHLIQQDLYRRDFTINSLAIKLNENEFGTLYDFFNGEQDLKKKVIKVLHNFSFIEDPTRIIRAIRFEQRLRFVIDSHTAHLMENAMKSNMLDQITKERIRQELILILSEEKVLPAVLRLKEFKILHYLSSNIILNIEMFEKAEKVIIWFGLLFFKEEIEKWIIYLLVLIDSLSFYEAIAFSNRLKLKRTAYKCIYISKKESMDIINNLKNQENLQNSFIYEQLKNKPLEVLLYIMAKTDNQLVKKRISFFLTHLIKISLNISGNDLIKLGIEKGKNIGKILNKVLMAKINGELKTKQDELKYAVKISKTSF